MRRNRLFALSVAATTGFAGLAILAQSAAPGGARMAEAAKKFLATLNAEQKSKATFAFDSDHRMKWYFTPQQDKEKKSTRKGLRMEDMTADQKAAALDLLKTGLSTKGFEQATTIISLEALLAELEGPKGAMVRNPNWYFVSVFGEPSNTGAWGWRVEGHHLSVNVTLDKGEVAAGGPMLFGSNPAEVKAGARKGLRTLPEIEDHARALIKSLTPEQDKVAKQAKHFGEIKEGQPNAAVGDPVGISAGKLSADQQGTLTKLLEAYANRQPADQARADMARVKAAKWEEITFGYSGSATPGEGYTYRVQGPTFVVEFLNVQADSAKNPANHIHSAWRRLPSDFAVKR